MSDRYITDIREVLLLGAQPSFYSLVSGSDVGGGGLDLSAGQNVTPAIKAAPARNIKKTTARSPAAEPSRCTSMWCSFSSMLGQSENKQSQGQHDCDEDAGDSHVIRFVRSNIEFHAG